MPVIYISNFFHVLVAVKPFYSGDDLSLNFSKSFMYSYGKNTFLRNQNNFYDIMVRKFICIHFFKFSSNIFWLFVLRYKYLYTIKYNVKYLCIQNSTHSLCILFPMFHIFIVTSIFAFHSMNFISKIISKIW